MSRGRRLQDVVLVADTEQWACLLELAGALRRRGLRVERVTVPAHMGGRPEDVFAQAWQPGEVVNVDGVAVDGEITVGSHTGPCLRLTTRWARRPTSW